MGIHRILQPSCCFLNANTAITRQLTGTARTLEAELWQVCGEAWVQGQRKMSQVLGALGLLTFTKLRSVLSWRAFWNLWNVYFFNFPNLIFGPRQTADTESVVSGVRLYTVNFYTNMSTVRVLRHEYQYGIRNACFRSPLFSLSFYNRVVCVCVCACTRVCVCVCVRVVCARVRARVWCVCACMWRVFACAFVLVCLRVCCVRVCACMCGVSACACVRVCVSVIPDSSTVNKKRGIDTIQ